MSTRVRRRLTKHLRWKARFNAYMRRRAWLDAEIRRVSDEIYRRQCEMMKRLTTPARSG